MEKEVDPDWSPIAPSAPRSGDAGKSTSEKRCILHPINPSQSQKRRRQEVLTFGEQQWAAVEKATGNRQKKANFETSRYFDIVRTLPEKPGDNDGYHSTCYKNFTAVTAEKTSADFPSDDAPSTSAPYLRSESSHEKPSTSGVFTSTRCLFCENVKKSKIGSHELTGCCETDTANQSIRDAAVTLNDSKILSKLGGENLISKEVKYHHSCKSAYLLSATRIRNKRNNQKVPAKSMVGDIHTYVEQSVIINKRPELLTSVFARYEDMCSTSGETPSLSSSFSLMRNLMTKFGHQIKCQTPYGKKSGTIIYNSEIADDAVRVSYDYASDDEQIVTRAALLLRKGLLSVQKKELPENPTLNDLKEGDTSPTELLVKFFTTLYSGGLTNCSDQVMRRVRSSCDDVLFIVRRGHVKPAKQVTLGVAMKSMTGSKKVVQILNRLGHSLNYNCIEELETESAEQILDRQLACPSGSIVDEPMGLAFDNFDELTNTLSGSNTLHDTMGIMYQNIPQRPEDAVLVEETVPTNSCTQESRKSKGRQRSLEQQEKSLQPYRKKPRMTVFSYSNTDIFSLPDIRGSGRKLDLMWMMNHALGVERIPMWVGYNANLYEDKLPKQEVRYMPNMKFR